MRVGSSGSALSASVSQSDHVQSSPTTQSDSSQKSPETKPTTSKADKLDISNTSEQLAKSSAVTQQNDVRSDKVAQIKKAIDNNEYQVSSRAVAEKMLFSFSRGPTA